MPHPTHKDRREAILENKNGFFYLEDFVYHKESVKEAMSEYAEEVALGFEQWMYNNKYSGRLDIDTKELFTLFLKQSQQSK